MALRKRFNPIDFYRRAAKPLSVAAPKTRFRPATTPGVSGILPNIIDKFSPVIADYITAEREKKRAAAARAEMKDVLSAYYNRGGERAREAVLNAPMDMDETAEDVDRDALIAFNRPGGIEAVNRMDPSVSLEAQDMRIALMGDAYRQEREREAAELKRSQDIADAKLAHQRKIELRRFSRGSGNRGYASRPASALQYTERMTEVRDKLRRLESEDKQNTPEYRRTRQILDDLRTNIAKAPDVRFASAQAKKSGALAGEKNSKDYFQARDVIGNVKDIDDLTSRLQAVDGSALGFLAELKQQRDRVFALFGSKEALAKVTDVELVDALMGAEVFALIKVLGIGARGLDTPAERKFLRQVLTGSIELTQGTLLEMAAKRRRLQVRRVTNWNERLKAGDYDNFYANNDYLKRPLPVPGPAPVRTPINITGPVSKMTAPQLGALFNSGKATPTQIEQIKTRLKALGFPVTK